ncbi:MAG: radical SAM family heme chaperone HemW [Termitinemataceae bacterium]
MTASLYLHVPFCASHCDYCDFYSVLVSSDDSVLDRYVDHLQAEVKAACDTYSLDRVPTLYIGGGTPSILGSKRLSRLLRQLTNVLPAWPSEVTVETNPESLTEDFLASCRDGGVTRLSLGIQSLNEASRRAVHRSGSLDHCRTALRLAGRYFPGSFSVDLLAGLPFQTEKSLTADIQDVVDAGAVHVSLYALTLEEGTPLHTAWLHNSHCLPEEETAESIWLAGRAALEAQGLMLYEVSNFARRGAESQHNLRYWRMESWVGLGPGASSTLIDENAGTALRITNEADLHGYLSADVQGESFVEPYIWATTIPRIEESLDRRTLLKESLMMGFRTIYGPEPDLFKRRFHRSIGACIPKTLEKLAPYMADAGRTALTREGLHILNRFLTDCFAEIDEAPEV